MQAERSNPHQISVKTFFWSSIESRTKSAPICAEDLFFGLKSNPGSKRLPNWFKTFLFSFDSQIAVKSFSEPNDFLSAVSGPLLKLVEYLCSKVLIELYLLFANFAYKYSAQVYFIQIPCLLKRARAIYWLYL